jgi:hypothetical protein
MPVRFHTVVEKITDAARHVDADDGASNVERNGSLASPPPASLAAAPRRDAQTAKRDDSDAPPASRRTRNLIVRARRR